MQQSLDGIEPAKPSKTRRGADLRDETWRALFAAMIDVIPGEPPITNSERGIFARAIDQLRKADATVDDLRTRAARWTIVFPGATLTASAIARQWGRLAPPRTITYAKPWAEQFDTDKAAWERQAAKNEAERVGAIEAARIARERGDF